jgi:hypothetical protein
MLEIEQGLSEQEEESHVEYVVIDKAGRLQIPAAYLDSIGLKQKNKVRVMLEEGKISLLPPE